jgi:hypothetical protein
MSDAEFYLPEQGLLYGAGKANKQATTGIISQCMAEVLFQSLNYIAACFIYQAWKSRMKLAHYSYR